jgi:O-antigen ligase
LDYYSIYSIIFIAIGFYCATLFAVDKGGSFLDRFLLAGDEFDTQGQSRGFLVQTTLSLVLESPFTGVGLEIPDIGYPHNLIAESFLPLGIVGGLLFSILYVVCIFKSIKLLTNSSGEWGWLGILFIQYAVISLSSGSLYASSLFWYLLFASIGIDNRLASQAVHQREIELAGDPYVNR